RRVAPVVFDPPAEERVDLAGDVGQRQLYPLPDVQVPDRRLHGFQCRGTDRGCEAAEQLPVSRASDQPRSESITEEVEPDVRIHPFAFSILAVDDLRLGGMQLQAAFRQANLKLGLEGLGFLRGPA